MSSDDNTNGVKAMIQIDQDRVTRFLTEAHLRSGSGKGANGKIDVCVMQAVDWISGGNGKTDVPTCADRAIARFCIRLNDAPRFAEWRDELKPFAVRIAGTNQGVDVTRKRGYMAADWAVRTIAPMAFDYWAEAVPAKAEKARELAAKLRAVEPITDAKRAEAGCDVALDVAREVRAAAYAAAYADARAGAYAAADAAADADAYAAAGAAAAADAYAAARADARAGAGAAAFERKMWDESLRFLDRMIAVTE